MINSGYGHDIVRDKMQPKLAYKDNADYNTWKSAIKEKYRELLGLEDIENNRAENPNFTIEEVVEFDTYTRTRFTFESEEGATTPCYILIPKLNKEKYPVAITLQGHSTGFHNSIGVIKFDDDKGYADGRGAFALQAVKNGFIALAIEQRGMGERQETIPNRGAGCNYNARVALHMGRTIIGERVFDISCAIDMLKNFKECDLDKIVLTGNSGGGTATFYAGCYDERIKICAPSCAFSSYKDSILNVLHCSCNFIPGAYKNFDMGDLACLIAPRKFIAFAGIDDTIFPIKGVKEQFEVVSKIYEKEGVKDNCKLIVTPKGHWWCEDLIWPNILQLANELGWQI